MSALCVKQNIFSAGHGKSIVILILLPFAVVWVIKGTNHFLSKEEEQPQSAQMVIAVKSFVTFLGVH